MTLLFCGLGKGRRLSKVMKGHNNIHAFEANAEAIARVRKRFKRVRFHNIALGEKKGRVPFYVYSRNDSSSCGKISDKFIEHWKGFKGETLSVERMVDVECVNLYEWCQENGIDHVDYLITDLQGLDLTVLRTMEPMLRTGGIRKVECETEADDMIPSSYPDLPPCKFSDFKQFFAELPYRQTTSFTESWSWRDGVHRDLIWEFTG